MLVLCKCSICVFCVLILYDCIGESVLYDLYCVSVLHDCVVWVYYTHAVYVYIMICIVLV